MTKKDCPSAPCTSGSKLHGFVGPDGSIIRLTKPVIVDDTFIEEAHKGVSPTKRFRFSNTCVENCGYWNGSGCHLAAMAGKIAREAPPRPLPKCAIRKSCRWYVQEGAHVCHVCSEVVTDVRP